MNKKRAAFIAACLLCMSTACVRNISETMTETDPRGWHKAVSVTYDNKDTLSTRNIDLLVRFDRTFGYDRLTVAVTTIDPQGRSWCDTAYVDYPALQAEAQTFIEARSPYRTETIFPLEGTYNFSFRPIIPTRPEGVAAVGVNIY